MPWMPSSVSSASRRPERMPVGRSTWVRSPVTTMRVPSPMRVSHIFICTDGGVLRLVEDRIGMRQGAAAHEGQRRHLDLAVGQPADHLLGRHHVVQRVVERAQIGIDLLLHVAGQEAQPFAGLHRGAGQHDAVHLAGLQHRHRLRHREIGLAGAGRADAEHHLVRRPAPRYRPPGPGCAARPRRGGCGSPAHRTAAAEDRYPHPPAGSPPPPRAGRRSRRVPGGATALPASACAASTRDASPVIATRLPRHDSRTPSACSMRTMCRSWSPSSSGSSVLSLNWRVTALPWGEAAEMAGMAVAWLKRRLSPR